MLISCSACNSKYLVNSADLKPNGRKVQCAKCGHNWLQTTIDEEKGEKDFLNYTSVSSENTDNDIFKKNEKINLPATYEKNNNPSLANSIIVMIFVILLIVGFWLIKGNTINIFILINFYIKELFFNFKLLINDLATIVYQILN